MGLNICNCCSGSYPLHGYVDYKTSQVCRMCNLRDMLEGKLATVTQQAEALARKVNALEEFITHNIANETTSGLNSVEWPSIQASCSRASRTTASNQANTPETPITNNNNNNSVSQFQVVRNGSKPSNRRILPVTTYNKFQILTEEAEDTHEVRLAGDSLTRPMLVELCGRAPKSRKRFCMPGGGIDDIIAAREEVTNGASKDALYIFHVGTNDIQKTRSEELLNKYRNLIKQYKMKSRNIIISGILPRMSAENVFYSKAFSLNSRLNSLCKQEGVTFINTWDHFYQKSELFSNDGLHLNCVGSARLGRLLNEEVRNFWSKNGAQATPAVTAT